MTTGDGFFLLAAAKPGEQSKERSALSHGAFTYAVLEGIEGQADADGDGSLSVSELFGYVARRVPQLTGGGQHPYNKMEGTDLVLLNVGSVTPRPAPQLPPTSEPREGETRLDNVIGVLDFQNLRQDPSYDWISQALRLAFNTELSKVKALRVYSPELIDRTTRARGTDPLVTARELGIGRLLTGAYYVSDKTLRIDARIVDARTGVNEASDSVEGELDEFFDLQKRLVLSMLRRLRVQLSPEEGQSIEKQTNTDVDAYRLLLESEGIVEPSPRVERTQPKKERHSALEHALDRFAAAAPAGRARRGGLAGNRPAGARAARALSPRGGDQEPGRGRRRLRRPSPTASARRCAPTSTPPTISPSRSPTSPSRRRRAAISSRSCAATSSPTRAAVGPCVSRCV